MSDAFSDEAFRRLGARVTERMAEYVRQSASGVGPVVTLRPIDAIAADLDLDRWIREGGLDGSAFDAWLDCYLDNTTRLHHPRFMAHQVAVPSHSTAIADLINGVTNNGMAIYEMGPAAGAVEMAVVNWMLSKVGWEPSRRPGVNSSDPQSGTRPGAGILTHGGSLANLTALLAARGKIAPEAWDDGVPGDLVILAPPSCHYSIARAASIAGLGSKAIRHLEVDTHEVILPERLEGTLDRVRSEGRRVMAVLANACSTATGLHDPLEPIGQFCREHGLWFHVDCAHGASALLSSRDRHHLRGVELADSIVWDAHKMLRTSNLCAAVLFRDERSFEHLFRQQASYLFYGDDNPGIDLIHHTIECTKQPLGLKLFLTLAWAGEAALARYVEDQYESVRRFHRMIAARPGFDCPYEPESNLLCFRFGDSDAQQIRIKERLLAEGSFYIGSTEIAGRRFLRLAVMGPATDDGTIEELLGAIERVAVAG